MESKRRRSWLWVVIVAVGVGIYVYSTRPELVSSPAESGTAESGTAESGDVVDLNPQPAEGPAASTPSSPDKSALSPVTGIADDAAEALRRMNEDAEKMMENPEMTSGEASK